MMTSYLDPKNDLVFKKIFGEHEHLLIDFLNALLPLPADGTIQSIEYLQPEQIPAIPTFYRRSIVDVRCKDQIGRQFIVEMQMFWTSSFQQRMLFNASQAYVQQISPGEPYQSLHPVYGLGIINDVFDHESDDWYHHYHIVRVGPPVPPVSQTKTPKTRSKSGLPHVINGLSFVFVELPKFRSESVADRKLRALWLRFLKEVNEGEFEAPPEMLNYAPVCEALNIARRSAFSKGELWAYQTTIDAIRSERTLLEERESNALQQGRVEGRAEGRAEGASDKALAIARNLLDILDDATIAAKTNLSVADIRQLRT